MANTTLMGCAGAAIGIRMSKNARQVAIDVFPTLLAATAVTRAADNSAATGMPLLGANEVSFAKYVSRFAINTNVADTGVCDRFLVLQVNSRSGRALASSKPIPILSATEVAAITATLVTVNAALASKKIVVVAKYIVA